MSKFFAALLIGGCMISPASAALIVDTGTPVNNAPVWALNSWQYFGGKFSIGSDQTVNAIEGFFSAVEGGNISFAIHANGGNAPGAVLYATSRTVTDNTSMNWHGVSGLNWALSAGNYWVSFKPDADIAGGVSSSAANPLVQYAQGYADYQWWPLAPEEVDFLRMGVRIDATPTATEVPEPGSVALSWLALAGLCLARRRVR